MDKAGSLLIMMSWYFLMIRLVEKKSRKLSDAALEIWIKMMSV